MLNKKRLVVWIVLFLLIAPLIVKADIISPMLKPLAQISIADLYIKYASIVDFFIVFVIFGVVAKFALGEKYGESTKGLAIVVGLMMSLAFAYFERRYNFNLGQLDFLAMLIFSCFLVFFLYMVLRGFGLSQKFSIAVMFIVTYAIVGAFFPSAYEWINYNSQNNFGVALLQLLIHIALIVAVVKLIISIVTFKNKID